MATLASTKYTRYSFSSPLFFRSDQDGTEQEDWVIQEVYPGQFGISSCILQGIPIFSAGSPRSCSISSDSFPSGEERRFSPRRTQRAQRQRPRESESGLRSDDRPGMDRGGGRHDDGGCSRMRGRVGRFAGLLGVFLCVLCVLRGEKGMDCGLAVLGRFGIFPADGLASPI